MAMTLSVEGGSWFCASPILATVTDGGVFPEGSTIPILHLEVCTYDAEGLPGASYEFSGEPYGGSFTCDVAPALRAALSGFDYLAPYLTHEESVAEGSPVTYNQNAIVRYVLKAYPSWIEDSLYVDGKGGTEEVVSEDFFAWTGGPTEYERFLNAARALPRPLSVKPFGEVVSPGHVSLCPVLERDTEAGTYMQRLTMVKAPAEGMYADGRQTRSSFCTKRPVDVSEEADRKRALVTASDSTSGPCVMPRDTAGNPALIAYYKDLLNDIFSTRLLTDGQTASGNYYSDPTATFDSVFDSPIKFTRPSQYEGWLRNYLKSTLGFTSFAAALAEVPPTDASIFEAGVYGPHYREMVVYIKFYLQHVLPDESVEVDNVYVDTHGRRRDFLFVNHLGVLEDASALMRESLRYEVEKETYTNVSGPAYRPSYSLCTSRVAPRARWEMSSGFVTREWADWWAGEFLCSDRHWMKLDGRWVPVAVVPKESDAAVYDLSKADAAHVDFTVSLAYDGRVG